MDPSGPPDDLRQGELGNDDGLALLHVDRVPTAIAELVGDARPEHAISVLLPAPARATVTAFASSGRTDELPHGLVDGVPDARRRGYAGRVNAAAILSGREPPSSCPSASTPGRDKYLGSFSVATNTHHRLAHAPSESLRQSADRGRAPNRPHAQHPQPRPAGTVTHDRASGDDRFIAWDARNLPVSATEGNGADTSNFTARKDVPLRTVVAALLPPVELMGITARRAPRRGF